MENAVKALLIAAAVLIALLLITLALSIVNSNSEITNEHSSGAIDSVAAQSYNEPFTRYISDSTPGSNAKRFVKDVLNHNLVASSSTTFKPGEHIWINFYPKEKDAITHKFKTSDLQNIYNQILNGARYKIYITSCGTYSGGYSGGYVVCMSIKEL